MPRYHFWNLLHRRAFVDAKSICFEPIRRRGNLDAAQSAGLMPELRPRLSLNFSWVGVRSFFTSNFFESKTLRLIVTTSIIFTLPTPAPHAFLPRA